MGCCTSTTNSKNSKENKNQPKKPERLVVEDFEENDAPKPQKLMRRTFNEGGDNGNTDDINGVSSQRNQDLKNGEAVTDNSPTMKKAMSRI